MIIVTGAAGFIGSCMIAYLNEQGHNNVWAVDDFSAQSKILNLGSKQLSGLVHRNHLIDFLKQHKNEIGVIFHLGARTDTLEKNYAIFEELNVQYTKELFAYCSRYDIPLIYASSAATYGDGSLGFDDRHDIVTKLKPMNAYAESKNAFDIWALGEKDQPTNWYGLKFFNVFGPNEYHKSRMASVIFHAYKQIQDTGSVKLFKSHRSDVRDGFQKRDFIYVKDVIKCCYWFWQRRPANGLYNVGTGKANTFLDLARYTFEALGLKANIEFIDTPIHLRNTYQYYTCANISKMRSAGNMLDFKTFKYSVNDYVSNYLVGETYM